MMICSDCGMQIYVNDADESVGGKHAVLSRRWRFLLKRKSRGDRMRAKLLLLEDEDKPAVSHFVCMPCSNKYEDVTHELLGESYEPIGDTKPKEPEE